MKRKSTRVSFDNGRGQELVGILDWPAKAPTAYAVLSHCFTCTKDLKALVRISRRLAEHGLCVLRFDFTGLGQSEGNFSETNFSTNCQDILGAAAFLGESYEQPKLLIGHSMGGTASALVANQLVQHLRAVVTIASPGSTHRLAGFLERSNPRIQTHGSGLVVIGGTEFELKKQLLDNLREQDIPARISELRVPILMFHSPQDETLPFELGLKMFEAAPAPKSFVTLEGADHLLLNQPQDVTFIADLINTWSQRYL